MIPFILIICIVVGSIIILSYYSVSFWDFIGVGFLCIFITAFFYHFSLADHLLIALIGLPIKIYIVVALCSMFLDDKSMDSKIGGIAWLSILFCIILRIGIATVGGNDANDKTTKESEVVEKVDTTKTVLPNPKLQEISKVKKEATAIHNKLNIELKNGKIESINTIVAKSELGEVVQTDVIRWINPKHLASYWFKSEKYTVETGGRIANIITCEKIEIACKELEKEGKTPSSESVWEKVKIKAGIDWKIFGIEFETTAHDLYELLWAEKQYQELDYEVEIFIKGYADNSVKKGWVRDMDAAYLFSNLKVNRVTALDMKEHPKNPRNYEAIPMPYNFPSNKKYQNEHLPNLRAAFIRQDFVEPFLKDCNPKNKHTKVYVLDGYHYSEPNQPENRMVEVYFQVYAKKIVN